MFLTPMPLLGEDYSLNYWDPYLKKGGWARRLQAWLGFGLGPTYVGGWTARREAAHDMQRRC
jgi:hypothetical protein